jgi:carbon storage regulator
VFSTVDADTLGGAAGDIVHRLRRAASYSVSDRACGPSKLRRLDALEHGNKGLFGLVGKAAGPVSQLASVLQGRVRMLVISRRKGQTVTIGDEIELVVTEVHRSSVKLGIRAPRGLTVLRGEVRESIELANRAAAENSTGLVEEMAPSSATPKKALDVAVLRRRPGNKGSS